MGCALCRTADENENGMCFHSTVQPMSRRKRQLPVGNWAPFYCPADNNGYCNGKWSRRKTSSFVLIRGLRWEGLGAGSEVTVPRLCACLRAFTPLFRQASPRFGIYAQPPGKCPKKYATVIRALLFRQPFAVHSFDDSHCSCVCVHLEMTIINCMYLRPGDWVIIPVPLGAHLVPIREPLGSFAAFRIDWCGGHKEPDGLTIAGPGQLVIPPNRIDDPSATSLCFTS